MPAQAIVLGTSSARVVADASSFGQHLTGRDFGVGQRREFLFEFGTTGRARRMPFRERGRPHVGLAPQTRRVRRPALELGAIGALFFGGDEIGAPRCTQTLPRRFDRGRGRVALDFGRVGARRRIGERGRRDDRRTGTARRATGSGRRTGRLRA